MLTVYYTVLDGRGLYTPMQPVVVVQILIIRTTIILCALQHDSQMLLKNDDDGEKKGLHLLQANGDQNYYSLCVCASSTLLAYQSCLKYRRRRRKIVALVVRNVVDSRCSFPFVSWTTIDVEHQGECVVIARQ